MWNRNIPQRFLVHYDAKLLQICRQQICDVNLLLPHMHTMDCESYFMYIKLQ